MIVAYVKSYEYSQVSGINSWKIITKFVDVLAQLQMSGICLEATHVDLVFASRLKSVLVVLDIWKLSEK